MCLDSNDLLCSSQAGFRKKIFISHKEQRFTQKANTEPYWPPRSLGTVWADANMVEEQNYMISIYPCRMALNNVCMLATICQATFLEKLEVGKQ